VFEYIGEDDAKIGDESRSYLGEHIFKQVFSIYATEEDKRERAGKGNRKASDQKSEAVVGALLQMAEQRDGSAGSDSVPKPKSVPRRTKDSNGKTKPKTDLSV
jgi:hypothetical protein